MKLIELAVSAEVSIELAQWGHPLEGSWENLQIMNTEICINKLMGKYKYVAIFDYDEYLVPWSKISLPEMLTTMERKAKHDIHKLPNSFRFKSAFFYPVSAAKKGSMYIIEST